jgi:hypothetical protein
MRSIIHPMHLHKNWTLSSRQVTCPGRVTIFKRQRKKKPDNSQTFSLLNDNVNSDFLSCHMCAPFASLATKATSFLPFPGAKLNFCLSTCILALTFRRVTNLRQIHIWFCMIFLHGFLVVTQSEQLGYRGTWPGSRFSDIKAESPLHSEFQTRWASTFCSTCKQLNKSKDD